MDIWRSRGVTLCPGLITIIVTILPHNSSMTTSIRDMSIQVFCPPIVQVRGHCLLPVAKWSIPYPCSPLRNMPSTITKCKTISLKIRAISSKVILILLPTMIILILIGQRIFIILALKTKTLFNQSTHQCTLLCITTPTTLLNLKKPPKIKVLS